MDKWEKFNETTLTKKEEFQSNLKMEGIADAKRVCKEESSYVKYWDVNNLYGWAMWEKLPVNKVEWIEDSSLFNEDFIKSHSEERDEGYFLEVDV